MLTFEPGPDGFRATTAGGVMVARVITAVLTGYDRLGAAVYAPLPRAECSVHSGVGPLPVAALEAILARLPPA